MLQQAGEGLAVEYLGQAIQRGGQLRAFQLAAQVLDFGLGSRQAIEKLLLLLLHQLGAFLQVVQHAGKVVDDGLMEGRQAGRQAVLVRLAAADASADIALDVIHQVDDLLLPLARFLELTTDDVLAKQLEGGFRGEDVEVVGDLVQAAIEIRFHALAVGVPEGVMHRVRRNGMTHHVRNGLLEQVGGLTGFFGEKLKQRRMFRRLAHALHCGGMSNGQSIDQAGCGAYSERPGFPGLLKSLKVRRRAGCGASTRFFRGLACAGSASRQWARR
ncbi:hypothetical protein D9M71_199290 [compost metagenome]